jgi:succinate dehydrogenase / fumarate reductase, cytochrome b subunit
MSNSKGFLKSSIGKKFIMGLTGLFLISFLVVHVSINSLMFIPDNGETFNMAAGFMAHNPVIRIVEIGLFVGLILHIFQAWVLTRANQAARPTAYAQIAGAANSSWYSRSMGLLGTLLLLFLVMHLYHFWWPTKVAVFTDAEHNTFEEIKEVFSSSSAMGIVSALLYVVGCISLAYHLLHGFQSAFQTLGINHRKYTPAIKRAGIVFSIIVPLAFALMPIGFIVGFIK